MDLVKVRNSSGRTPTRIRTKSEGKVNEQRIPVLEADMRHIAAFPQSKLPGRLNTVQEDAEATAYYSGRMLFVLSSGRY
jgi:hypothetical protein